MNSDPHESAAWRTFGMLDADEAAGFDEAMRQDPELRAAYREMNSLTAAVAATTVMPISPRAGQLERLKSRLGLLPIKSINWPAISGWAAAAALTAVLIIDQKHSAPLHSVARTPVIPEAHDTKIDQPPQPRQTPAVENSAVVEASPAHSTEPPTPAPAVATQESEVKAITKVETKRLIQEIEVLRVKLESAQKRDRKRFEPIAGMAWPIVMKMSQPNAPVSEDPAALAAADETSLPLTTMLGDALAGNSVASANTAASRLPTGNAFSKAPTAIPIYDAARDAGTLVVKNLETTTPEQPYNLWVTTENGDKPIHVGRLPALANQEADSFDFSLGSTGIIPTGYFLTKDAAINSDSSPAEAPSTSNIILQGPQ